MVVSPPQVAARAGGGGTPRVAARAGGGGTPRVAARANGALEQQLLYDTLQVGTPEGSAVWVTLGCVPNGVVIARCAVEGLRRVEELKLSIGVTVDGGDGGGVVRF